MNTDKMKPMKEVLFLVIHCSATRPSQKVTVDDLDRYHTAKGWAGIGYHWVVYRDGTIHPGRPESKAGAHVKHYNEHAIGICYIGGHDEKGRPTDTRTPEQKAALWFLLKDLRQSYPKAKILGHRDFPLVRKECPCFSCLEEYESLNATLKPDKE